LPGTNAVLTPVEALAWPTGPTAVVDPAWLTNRSGANYLPAALPDGVYWAMVQTPAIYEGWLDTTYDAPRHGVTFDVSQAFFGDSCPQQFDPAAPECDDGVGAVLEPHGWLPSFTDTIERVTVVNGNEPHQSYDVSSTLFEQLTNAPWNGQKSTGVWPEFLYQSYPYLITVRAGEVVEVQQLYLPL
jgi:hypothetical protein